MKKEIIIGSTLCLLVILFLVIKIGQYQGELLQAPVRTLSPVVSTPAASAVALPSPTASKTSYTLFEVQQHNTAQDCWQAFYGGVYDLTDYIELHPGGKNMINYCGQEATAVFEGIKKGRGHSDEAKTIMKNYYIGTLR